jgi:zinc D-Ala-D-Ala dipeptidase
MKRHAWWVGIAAWACVGSTAHAQVAVPAHFVDVGEALGAHVELKYSTTDNFMKRDVYGDFERCYLHPDAARMLQTANEALRVRAPGLRFALYDCARPTRVQVIMWDVVKGTPQQGYVANPHKPPGSMHNRGCAVDLSLWDDAAKAPVDMGTAYDHLGPEAEPRRELDDVKAGKLSAAQWANRLLLREVMVRAGFRVLAHEWWHFDCADQKTAARQYPPIP